MNGEVTRLLERWRGGEREALDALVPLVYAELKRIASACLCGERSGGTLQVTALVHEAYLRMADYREPNFECRKHFYVVAAQAMRRILIDHARRRHLGKEHPETLRIMGSLVLVYRYEGKFKEAEPLARSAVELERRVFGEMNRDTLASMDNLAEVLRMQGRYGEAETHNLGLLYMYEGKYSLAEPLFTKALAIARRDHRAVAPQ